MKLLSSEVKTDRPDSHRYIEYARHHCNPRLSESAAASLQTKYVEIRQVC